MSEPAAEARLETPTGRLRVLHRLGPAQFGLAAGLRAPMGSIAGDARPVLRAADARHVASANGLAADAEGQVRAELALAAEWLARPDAAFALEVQVLPGDVPEALMERLAEETFRRRVSSGWSLARREGAAVLRYATGDPSPKPRYNLHLLAYAEERLQVASAPFEVPAGARLELAYGLASSLAEVSELEVPVRFAARLACDDAEPVAIVAASLDPASERRWHEVSLPLPPNAACRLGLEAAGPEGEAVRGALWARPRVLAPEAPEAPANLLLVSLDTLRADHLSGYGYARTTSPRIDAELIAAGTAFMDVTTTYSRTDVSHMSLFTGLYPEARPQPGRLHADTPVPVLAERLAEAGFSTGAYAEDALLAGAFGFWFGFDRFVEDSYVGVDRGVHSFAKAREWLRAHADHRFFLFVHTYKTHAPYAASEAYAHLFRDPADWEREGMSAVPPEQRENADEYDRTIREADDLVGSLLDELELLGLSENTLVVVTSDHGEAFGEHRIVGHSSSSHQEVMRVPLVLRGPGVPAGLRVDAPVSLVDLKPTLLELLGLAPPARGQGVSLAPALRGEALPESRGIFFSWLQQSGEGVRYGPWKYHRRARGGLLYNLDDDPGERKPLGARLQERPYAGHLLSEHVRRSQEMRAEIEAEGGGRATPAISKEMEESLRALGYIE